MDRFHKTNHTVLDYRTGLMWSMDASPGEFPMTWAEAFEFVGNLNRQGYEGYNDWRLPNRRELFSLVSHDRINPCVPAGHPFENIFHGYYWSATTCARLPDQAWYVHLGGAKVYRGMKYASYMVWPVRTRENLPVEVIATGQNKCYDEHGSMIDCAGVPCQHASVQSGIKWPEPRFTVRNEIAIDRLTGLTWTIDACRSQDLVTWEQAWEIIRQMNIHEVFGHGCWRVPHVRELESLVDMGTHSPALVSGHPFVNVNNFYWSGTTSMFEQRYAWTLYTKDGAVGVGFKRDPEFALWPVCGKYALAEKKGADDA